MSNSSKPTLFFDFHGTLVYPDNIWFEAVHRIVTRLHPGRLPAEETLRAALGGRCLPWFEMPERDTRSVAGSEKWWAYSGGQFKEMFVRCGFSVEEAAALAPLMQAEILNAASHRLYPDTISTLSMLQQRGYRLFLLSNNFPELEEITDELKLKSYFEGFIISGLLGYEKPRPEIFAHARQLAGDPAKAVMIGDNPKDDIEGAKAAGFATVQIGRPPRSHAADYYIESLTELLDIFH